MKSKFLLIAMVIATTVFSCSKKEKDLTPSNQEINGYNSSPVKSSGIVNLTPQEILQVANLHNQTLTDLYANFDLTAADYSDELYEQVMSLENTGFSTQEKDGMWNMCSSVDRNYFISQLNDPSAVAYIDQADGQIMNISTIPMLEQSLSQLQIAVENDPNVIQKDATVLYIEVLKKSAYFWSDPSIGGSGVGNAIIISGPTLPSKIECRICNVILADAIGGAAFTIVGGPFVGGFFGAVASGLAFNANYR